MKSLFLMLLMVCLSSAYAFNYDSTPTGSANPPESIEQDLNVPITPNVYTPATPLSKQPPPGTTAAPGATESNKPNYLPVYPKPG